MSRKYHTLRLGDDQYRLRLTIRGQNNLRERFQEDTIQTVLGAATDSRRMVALLEEALNWEGNENPVTDGERFYDLLVDQGYIARNSSHTRGSAVDLTLADSQGVPLDMGTGFDYFGQKAWHGAKDVTEQQAQNRQLLCDIMEKHGFRRFAHEWWHYKLVGEPFPETSFNFPVQ